MKFNEARDFSWACQERREEFSLWDVSFAPPCARAAFTCGPDLRPPAEAGAGGKAGAGGEAGAGGKAGAGWGEAGPELCWHHRAAARRNAPARFSATHDSQGLQQCQISFF